MFGRLPVGRLIDSLMMALPLAEQEKQMLLETVKPEKRLVNFIALIEADVEVPDSVTRHYTAPGPNSVRVSQSEYRGRGD